jgi:hypothetical protein
VTEKQRSQPGKITSPSPALNAATVIPESDSKLNLFRHDANSAGDNQQSPAKFFPREKLPTSIEPLAQAAAEAILHGRRPTIFPSAPASDVAAWEQISGSVK